eukprot:9541248-Karenia_brevis.AAC.1
MPLKRADGGEITAPCTIQPYTDLIHGIERCPVWTETEMAWKIASVSSSNNPIFEVARVKWMVPNDQNMEKIVVSSVVEIDAEGLVKRAEENAIQAMALRALKIDQAP